MGVVRVVVLGGYGNFGKRIVELLAQLEGLQILVAGRSLQRARDYCQELASQSVCARTKPACIDIFAIDFEGQLAELQPDLVIHTSGPFQGQDYRVAEACIAVGSHYIDLADDRRYVCDITTLNTKARERGVLLVSGASTVPGLSSVVIDKLASQFKTLESIDFAIAPGNKAERGEATVRAILSYTGHPMPVWVDGRWQQCFGWMSVRRWHFGNIAGNRWLANVDVPDLELFASRYRGIKTVKFQAGLEMSLLHLAMVAMAALVRIKLVRNWAPLAGPIFRLSNVMKAFGTDIGGMRICLRGMDCHGKPQTVDWVLTAENGVGPYIPTFSALILARKLIAGSLPKAGAMPCLGLYSLDEFDKLAASYGIYHHTVTSGWQVK